MNFIYIGHLLLIPTNLGYGTILTAACALQSCSASVFYSYICTKNPLRAAYPLHTVIQAYNNIWLRAASRMCMSLLCVSFRLTVISPVSDPCILVSTLFSNTLDPSYELRFKWETTLLEDYWWSSHFVSSWSEIECRSGTFLILMATAVWHFRGRADSVTFGVSRIAYRSCIIPTGL
jgi:hypothetical protein